MVIAAFPAAKLGALLIKQISKPIANAVKEKAKSSPVFRKYVCLPPAQFYQWCELKSKMWILNLGKPVNIAVLNEASAIELGANLVGESVIFIIAASLLIAEYTRSSRKETAKEEAKNRELLELKSALRDLFIQTEEQGAHIRELTRKVGDLETRMVRKPWVLKPDTSPSTDEPTKEPPEFLRRLDDEAVNDAEAAKEIDQVENEVTSTETNNLMDSSRSRSITSKKTLLPNGLLWRAIYEFEMDFWGEDNNFREPSILNVALNYLCKDVYKINLSF